MCLFVDVWILNFWVTSRLEDGSFNGLLNKDASEDDGDEELLIL